MDAPRRLGIIESLSGGFRTVNSGLWVIAIPLLLDLLFWTGPQLTAAPVVDQALGWYESQVASANEESALSNETVEAQVEDARTLAGPLADQNLLSVLAWGLPWGPPSIMNLTSQGAPLLAKGPKMEVRTIAGLVLLLPLLALASLLAAAVYFRAVAQVVLGEGFDREAFVRDVVRDWGRLVLLALLALGFVLMVVVPSGLAISLAAVISPALGAALGALLGFILWVVALGLFLYLFFVVSAMFAGNENPFRAIRDSVTVVRRSFWTSVGLVVLVYVVLFGTALAWSLVMGNTIGLLAAMVGNAYIGSGLAAACMIFYRDRVSKWQESEA